MKMTAFAQGEIYARKIENLPCGLADFNERDAKGRWIIAHSETGHHHLLDAPGVDVKERENAPEGMRILYAIVSKPTQLWQDAGNPHEAHDIEPGVYEMRIAREFDPIMQQARRVAD